MAVGTPITLDQTDWADGRLEFRQGADGTVSISGFCRLTDAAGTARRDISIGDWPASFTAAQRTALLTQLVNLINAITKDNVPGAATVTRQGTRFVAS